MTSSPDNPKTDKQAVEAHVDAAIRELDQLHRRDSRTDGPATGATDPDAASDPADASANEAGLKSQTDLAVVSVPSRPDNGALRAAPHAGSDVAVDEELFAPEPPPGPVASGKAAEQTQWIEVDLGAEPPAAGAAERPAAAAPESEGQGQVLVDLGPVREAMKSVALQRAEAPVEAPPLGLAPIAAPAAASGEPFAVESTDAAVIGVLLVNSGAPDAPKTRAVRRYLRECLSDRRVIEKDTFGWQVALRSVILPFRPRSRARAYRSIWNKESNESPLKTVTRSQAEQLGEALTLGGSGVIVDWAMRYGNPSIETGIRALIARGCERIVLVPLFPQYASATTATVCDETFRALMRLRRQPSLRVAPPYYANPVYIDAIASSIRDHLGGLTFKPEVILAAYHGLPQEAARKGDPYDQQCLDTTALLRERLGLDETQLVTTFQPGLRRGAWLRPYTDETLRKLAKEGVRNVAVVAPGFAADGLATLRDIAIDNARVFKKRGGENFAFIPCLNDSEQGVRVIREIVLRELKGWV